MTGPTSMTSVFQGDAVRLAFGTAFTVLMLAACVTDVRRRRIPNTLVLLLTVGGIVFSTGTGVGWSGLWRSLAGLGLGFAIWIVFYMVGVLGAGDVKLAASAGAWLGASGIWRASLVAGAVGGVLAVGMLLRERRMVDTLNRIATSVSTRSLALLTPPTDSTVQERTRSRPMPYGVALAIGAVAVAWIPGLLV